VLGLAPALARGWRFNEATVSLRASGLTTGDIRTPADAPAFCARVPVGSRVSAIVLAIDRDEVLGDDAGEPALRVVDFVGRSCHMASRA
jgi:hypothetical protein